MSRRRSLSGSGEASVTRRKLAKLRRIAGWLASQNGWERVRIDVVAVEVERGESGLRVMSVRHLRDVR